MQISPVGIIFVPVSLMLPPTVRVSVGLASLIPTFPAPLLVPVSVMDHNVGSLIANGAVPLSMVILFVSAVSMVKGVPGGNTTSVLITLAANSVIVVPAGMLTGLVIVQVAVFAVLSTERVLGPIPFATIGVLICARLKPGSGHVTVIVFIIPGDAVVNLIAHWEPLPARLFEGEATPGVKSAAYALCENTIDVTPVNSIITNIDTNKGWFLDIKVIRRSSDKIVIY